MTETEQREQKGIINDFTQGPILRRMLLFAIPFMLSNALQVFYALVDMLVVGRFVGSYGLSAVSVASQVFTFMTMLCLGFCTGGQVYISQLIGGGQRDRLNGTIGTLFTTVGVLAAAMTLLGLAFKRPVLELLNTPPEAFGMAMDYMLVCSVGMVFTYGYNLVAAILRGMGDSRRPFLFILIASVINIVLDLLFVGVFHWGVGGAALATILGQAFSFLYALYYLYRHRDVFGFDFRRSSFRVNRQVLKALARLGIPFALQSCAINVSMLFVNALVNNEGVHASATFGVGVKLDDIINKVTQGITFAVSTMVGQNIAAGKDHRAKRVVYCSWGVCAVCYLVFTVLYVAFTEEMFGVFTDDPNVIALGGVFVSAVVWGFPAMAIMKGTNGFIQGVGDAMTGLVFSILDGFVFRIFLSYLFGTVLHMGLFGFFLGFSIAPFGTAIPGAVYFLSGVWKKRKLSIE